MRLLKNSRNGLHVRADAATRLELRDACFDYPVIDVADRSIKLAIAKRVYRGSSGHLTVRALRNINLTFEAGERVGLIGSNGAGKSTLLRVIGGLAFPTQGKLITKGKALAILDKSMGVNPEFSGAENIELPLRIMGANTAQVRAARDDIEAFAELGQFFHLPVRRYSDGMRARLAFGLATAIPADILILDEWLSAGDANFVHKAERRLTEFLDKIKIVVLASHSLDLLRTVCTRVVWLENGEVVNSGPPEDIIAAYVDWVDSGFGKARQRPAQISLAAGE
jgi:ABC-2 type transport system ATP-binding protein/lipopolysaccharide transport system ATP-binding protein